MEAFHPRRVLETGSGHYSTNLFLSYDIEALVSVENNPDWVIDTEDPRHELRVVEGPVGSHLPPLDGFDLVFVDDDPVHAREWTISQVLDSAPGLVVIHDTDYFPFHRFIADRPNYTDLTRRPNTTVVHPQPSAEFDAWLTTV